MDLSLAGWSLHRRFQNRERPLSLLDFPATAREEFKIDRVELNSPFFEYANRDAAVAGPFRRGYIRELRRRADQAGAKIVAIAVDGHGDLSDLDARQRAQALDRHRKWFDACHELGCPAFRANSGGPRTGEIGANHVGCCTESFAKLAEWAGEAGLTVLMENHWGLSADPDRLVAVIRNVASDSLGALADFRNFPPTLDLYTALAKIAPWTRYVHAKFLSFDGRGEDPDFDTARVMGIFRDAGYRGLFGIEFEGAGDDHDGVLRSRDLLERHAYTL
ncbi:MAG TPA: sugar phosphate isomerase/epimerase family protein [Phycisphaerae bacterium]|nr:sugar phosphate isomerase/epimerase family protein [Phycisphaerae bacterium]HRY67182.1 sugar phosphate isomerase/epimerase family protein [Phycisphaerae bacterium]HSA26449.1 sugar phosphate isomerase/epimerase family protein [Phycisphaerae bacterium]